MPPITDVPINGFDSSRNKAPFVIFVFFSPYGIIKVFLKRHEKELKKKTS